MLRWGLRGRIRKISFEVCKDEEVEMEMGWEGVVRERTGRWVGESGRGTARSLGCGRKVAYNTGDL